MSGHDPSACQEVLEDAAVALLTRAPLPAPVLAHLDRCPVCRDEVTAMASLPARLALARDARLVAEVQPSPQLLPRLLREVHRGRVKRRWITVAAAAAAATVAVGTTLGLELVRSGSGSGSGPGSGTGSRSVAAAAGASSPASSGPARGPTPTGPSPVTEPVFAAGQGKDPVTGASAEVTVRAADWGSHVQIEVYDVPANTQCRLVVVDRHGKRAEAGSWNVTSRGYRADGQTFTEAVATRAQDVARVELIDNRTQRRMIQVTVVRV